MASNDLQRAETLANLFASPVTAADVPPPEPVEDRASSTGKKPQRKLAVVEAEPVGETETAVAEAVGVLDTVITIPTDVEADELREAAEVAADESASVAEEAFASPDPAPDVDLVGELTTKMGLKGAADRHNIPVSGATGKLLQSLDKELALSGRPIVSRNALITAAARKVIADPGAYAKAPGRDPREPSTAIQGRVPAGLPADLRAAAYSVEPPLVVAHAMAAAVQELLNELMQALKKGRRGRH